LGFAATAGEARKAGTLEGVVGGGRAEGVVEARIRRKAGVE